MRHDSESKQCKEASELEKNALVVCSISRRITNCQNVSNIAVGEHFAT